MSFRDRQAQLDEAFYDYFNLKGKERLEENSNNSSGLTNPAESVNSEVSDSGDVGGVNEDSAQ